MKKTEVLPRSFLFALLVIFMASALLLPANTQQGASPRNRSTIAGQGQRRGQAVSEDYAFAERIRGLLNKGDFKGAIAAFDSLPEEKASSLEMQKLKLSVVVSSGDTKAASQLAASIEAKHGLDTEVLFARAVIALAENKSQERERHLKKILEIDPKNLEALLMLGEDSMSKKSYGDAVKWYSQALSIDKGNAGAYRGLAHAYYLQGKMKDARRTVDSAIAANPKDAALLAESALIYFEEKKLPAALEEMRKALAIDSSVSSYWSHYGVMLVRASKLPEARKALTEAIRLNPQNAFPYLYRCGVNDTLGYIDEAISDYRFVYKNYPQYYFAAEGLGTLLWIKGDYAGAKDAFSQAFQYKKDNLSYALMYTLCCYKLKQNDEAKSFIGKFMNTLNKTSTEYFLCRLFYDLTGDNDVTSRVSRHNDEGERSKLQFYLAAYYDILKSESSLAKKLYAEVASEPEMSFFEHKLASAAIEKTSTRTGLSQGAGRRPR